jgi:predicted GH43/DUF377 family glycosyl hydrolase
MTGKIKITLAFIGIAMQCFAGGKTITKKPCLRIEFEPMHQLMCYGDATYRNSSSPFSKDPTVIRHNGRYLMYYSVNYDSRRFPRKLHNGKVRGWWGAVAESADLVNWKRIGDIEITGDVEFSSIAVAPCVKKLDGKIHLFCQGKAKGGNRNDAIWHATSEDGITFKLNGDKPIFRPKCKWALDRAIDAEVYKVDDRLILMYATRDPDGKIQMLGMASAPYGSDYGADKWMNLSDDKPLIKPDLPWEMNCIEAPTVIKHKGIWYMFYAGAYNHERQQIGVAWSADGINYKRLQNCPVLPHGPEKSWNAWESGHPGVFVDDDGMAYLFYQGKASLKGDYRLSCLKIRFVEK